MPENRFNLNLIPRSAAGCIGTDSTIAALRAPTMNFPQADCLSLFMRRASRVLAPLAASFLAVACSSAPKPVAPSNAAASRPAVHPADTFDQAWAIVRDQHFDPTLHGVDWIAVRKELRPKAASARNEAELRAVLNEMISRLGQSHFAIIPAEDADRSPAVAASEADSGPTDALAKSGATKDHTSDDNGLDGAIAADQNKNKPNASQAETASGQGIAGQGIAGPSIAGPGIAGIDIALVDGEPVVLRVAPGLPAARAGVLVGWKLVSVDGVKANDALDAIRTQLAAERDTDSPRARQLRAALAFASGELMHGEAGQTRTVVFADASGAEQQVRLAFEAAPLGSTKFGNLPPFPIEVDTRIVEVPIEMDKPVRVGVIAFNIWMTGASDAIDAAVDSMRSCDGIVIDLRGNPGGVGAMSMGVAGHFLRETASLGSMIGRDSTLEFRATPRKVSADGKRVRPYASKPLAILVDGRSASTSEVFAGGLQDLGRARVFGEATAGMALPAQATELANGDVFLHAVADFVTSKGTRLEGRGVIPDERTTQTREALLRGDDAAFLAAAKWIRGTTVTARASKSMPSSTPTIPSAEPTITPSSMPSAPVPSPNY